MLPFVLQESSLQMQVVSRQTIEMASLCDDVPTESDGGLCLSQKMSKVSLQRAASCEVEPFCGSQSTEDNRFKEMEAQGRQGEAEHFSSQDFVCTPDFITPVENQFYVGFEDSGDNGKRLSSPVSLTPVRSKRPRKDDINVEPSWLGDDILSTQPEPPQLQLPSHLFLSRPEVDLPPGSRTQPLEELEQAVQPGEGAGSESEGRIEYWPAPTPRSLHENASSSQSKNRAGTLNQGWNNRGCLQSGRQTVLSNVREKIASMRRRVQSPPCIPNPFLPSDVDNETKRKNLRPAGSILGGIPSVTSRYRADFHEVEEIGHGYFSRVFKVRQRIDGCLYAVKRTIRELRQDSERKQALTEVQALAALGHHKNVVRYYSAWYEADHLYIQMELCEGSVAQQAKSGRAFSEKELVEFLQQMASALAFVHSRGIVHLDVKPDNIYHSSGEYRLGDFGRATRLDGSMSVVEGDARYMPLEVLNSDYSDLRKTDMFSLGASVYELARNSPLPSTGASFQAIREGKLMLLPGYSAAFQQLIKALVHPNPSSRPSADELLKHALLAVE